MERIVAFKDGERMAALRSKMDSLKESQKRLEDAESRRSEESKKQRETSSNDVLEKKVSSLQMRWIGKERRAAAMCDGSQKLANELQEMYDFVPSLSHDSSACARSDGHHQRTQFEKLKVLLELKAAAVGVP